MRMDIRHPQAAQTNVVLDGKNVFCTAFDSDEGWADCYVNTETDGPLYHGDNPAIRLLSDKTGDPVIRRFFGRVSYFIGDED